MFSYTEIFGNWTEKHWLIFTLIAASFLTHFIWLGYPSQVVFDEVHFGKFVTAYCCTHHNFFDIHPPHAKLIIAGVARLFGYSGGMTFDNIGQSYGQVSTIPLRLFPALTGFILPLLIYLLLRQLGASKAAAFLGGMLVVFDNAITLQTRIIALDGLLLVSIFSSLSLFLAAKKEEKKRLKSSFLFIFCGAMAGLAVGTKFTGLVAPGLIFILFTVWLLGIKNRSQLKRYFKAAAFVLGGAIFTYLLGWALHFAILTEAGSGDAWRKQDWSQPIAISFLQETKEMHRIMYQANSGLQAEHHDGSSWLSWPLVRTPVFYWQHSEKNNSASIYFLGNPILWWGATSFLVIILLQTFFSFLHLISNQKIYLTKIIPFVKTNWSESFLKKAWLPILGYIASYAPFMLVDRVLFLYHYLTPLLFSIIIVVLWLDHTHLIKRGSILQQTKAFWIILAAAGLSFLYFSPFTYGFLLPEKIRHWLFWFSTWR